jgi:hypothetical protein
VIVYPDSGKVGVRLMDERYRTDATVDYWDGETDESGTDRS